MEAERERSKQVLNTQAAINMSPWKKETTMLKSEGSIVATRNQTDAEVYKIQQQTHAIESQIKQLANLFVTPSLVIQYLLELRQLKVYEKLSQSSNKVFFFAK